MKKSITKIGLMFLFVSLTFFSCSKDENPTPSTSGGSTTTPVTPPPSATGAFTWTENGGSVITADSAYWTTGTWGTGIRAYKGGYSNYFELNWATQDNISIGVKVLPTAIYGVTFLKGSDTYTSSTDQNLNITGSSNNKIDGNFTITVTGGTITTLAATFTGLTKN